VGGVEWGGRVEAKRGGKKSEQGDMKGRGGRERNRNGGLLEEQCEGESEGGDG